MSPSQSIRKVRGHHREADTIGLVINPWQAKLWRLGSITTLTILVLVLLRCAMSGSELLIASEEVPEVSMFWAAPRSEGEVFKENPVQFSPVLLPVNLHFGVSLIRRIVHCDVYEILKCKKRGGARRAETL